MTVIAGGLSNYSYLLEDAADSKWVLRCPPRGPLESGAHDIKREVRLLGALAPSKVPVPTLVGFEDDLLTVPFYVMNYVPGVVIREEQDALALAKDARRRAGLHLAETLADLHTVNPADVGLSRLGKGHGYLERQLHSWFKQIDQRRTPVFDHAGRVYRALLEQLPSDTHTSIVHGDYRLDNVIIDSASGEIRSVLDWELSTLGDPYADLAHLLVYWVGSNDAVRPTVSPATVLPGFVDRRQIVDTYLGQAGLQGDFDFTFYMAFANWRLALALDGVHHRFSAGIYTENQGEISAAAVRDLPRAVRELMDEATRLVGQSPH